MPSDKERIATLEHHLLRLNSAMKGSSEAYGMLSKRADELAEENRQNTINMLLLSSRLNALHSAIGRVMPTIANAWDADTAKAMEELSSKLGLESPTGLD